MCFSLKLKNKKLPPFLAEIWDVTTWLTMTKKKTQYWCYNYYFIILLLLIYVQIHLHTILNVLLRGVPFICWVYVTSMHGDRVLNHVYTTMRIIIIVSGHIQYSIKKERNYNK
jgi:hypothetical protein